MRFGQKRGGFGKSVVLDGLLRHAFWCFSMVFAISGASVVVSNDHGVTSA